MSDREQKITDVTAKYKETSVNLHMEQETGQRVRSERDSFEREIKSLQEEIKGLLSNQNSSSDAMAQRVTQLELEKKAIEKRLQQLEQDVYKANREKKEAVGERDSANGELQRVRKQKDDLEKALNEALDARNKLQGELDGKCIQGDKVAIEVKRLLA